MCVLFLIATLPRPTLSAPATWSPAFWAVLAACLVADPAGRAGVAQLSCACRFCGARVFDRRACGVFGDAWDGRRRRARRGCADGGGGGGGCRDAVAARVRDRAIVTRGRGGRWPVPQRLRDEMWWIRGCACLAWMSVALQRFTRLSVFFSSVLSYPFRFFQLSAVSHAATGRRATCTEAALRRQFLSFFSPILLKSSPPDRIK